MTGNKTTETLKTSNKSTEISRSQTREKETLVVKETLCPPTEMNGAKSFLIGHSSKMMTHHNNKNKI